MSKNSTTISNKRATHLWRQNGFSISGVIMGFELLTLRANKKLPEGLTLTMEEGDVALTIMAGVFNGTGDGWLDYRGGWPTEELVIETISKLESLHILRPRYELPTTHSPIKGVIFYRLTARAFLYLRNCGVTDLGVTLANVIKCDPTPYPCGDPKLMPGVGVSEVDEDLQSLADALSK